MPIVSAAHRTDQCYYVLEAGYASCYLAPDLDANDRYRLGLKVDRDLSDVVKFAAIVERDLCVARVAIRVDADDLTTR